MIWFTWRQFRTAAWITVAGLVGIAIVLAISGHSLANLWTSNGAAACHSNCGNVVSNFLNQARNSYSGRIYDYTAALLYVLPALLGIFWGAPLVARELETGTHRLAWNQSVTRTRWLASKLAVVGGASAATTGLLIWAITAWAHHIDYASDNRLTPQYFGARGIVPIGYALFAFVLGVTLGMLIRRTIPAMFATLAIYIGAVLSMPLWVRAHLVPASHVVQPLDTTHLDELMLRPDNTIQVVAADSHHPGAWLLSNQTITSTGHLFTGPASPQHCGPDQGPQSCLAWIDSLGLRQDITFQPASHFWPLQWTETAIFVAAAILLGGFCFWWTRKHLS